jgi:hypothetical protein
MRLGRLVDPCRGQGEAAPPDVGLFRCLQIEAAGNLANAGQLFLFDAWPLDL